MEITSKTVKDVSIELLAKIRQGLSSDHPDAIIIDTEIQRRQADPFLSENMTANTLAREANEFSRKANSIASKARDESRRANKIATLAVIMAALSMIITIIIALFK